LAEKIKKAVEMWREFGHLFPDVEQSEQANGLSVPTIDRLQAALETAVTKRDGKQEQGFRKAKNGFFDFLETMNDYSSLFSVVPTNDKYTSLITGLVSSIVKVGWSKFESGSPKKSHV
jgi:hypothetical protein